MDNPIISVIMPVYNGSKEFLSQAIESILNQTLKNFEFLIIDDGSTDPQINETILSYNDKRIKYLYKENSGVADSLNFGIKQAKGEYIARMDADDISLPERFEKQIAFLQSHPEVSLLGSWVEIFSKTGIKIWKTISEPKLFDFLIGSQLAHPVVMWRKKDFEEKKLKYDKNLVCSQDYDLWIRVSKAGLKIINLQEVLLKRRSHSNNISHTKREKQAQIATTIKENLLEFLTCDPETQEKIKIFICGSSNMNSTSKWSLFHCTPFLTIKRIFNKANVKLLNFISLFKIKEKK